MQPLQLGTDENFHIATAATRQEPYIQSDSPSSTYLGADAIPNHDFHEGLISIDWQNLDCEDYLGEFRSEHSMIVGFCTGRRCVYGFERTVGR
jgi:hypothetical protein